MRTIVLGFALMMIVAALSASGCLDADDVSTADEARDSLDDETEHQSCPGGVACGSQSVELNRLEACETACAGPWNACYSVCWAGPDDQEAACIVACNRTWSPCTCSCYTRLRDCGYLTSSRQHSLDFFCGGGGDGPVS